MIISTKLLVAAMLLAVANCNPVANSNAEKKRYVDIQNQISKISDELNELKDEIIKSGEKKSFTLGLSIFEPRDFILRNNIISF